MLSSLQTTTKYLKLTFYTKSEAMSLIDIKYELKIRGWGGVFRGWVGWGVVWDGDSSTGNGYNNIK